MNSRGLDYTALTIVIIGAINWGLIALFGLNAVDYLFGTGTIITRIIYAIVGISGLYLFSVYGRIADYSSDAANH